MADIDITQAEADALIGMEKRYVEESDWFSPGEGQRIALELTSADKRENFFLDVTRGQIKLTKATYQNRPAGDHSYAPGPWQTAAPESGRIRDRVSAPPHLQGGLR